MWQSVAPTRAIFGGDGRTVRQPKLRFGAPWMEIGDNQARNAEYAHCGEMGDLATLP